MENLFQRGVKGRWHVRLAVPRRIRPQIGKLERVRSLGTSDPDIAKRLARPILTEWEAEHRRALAIVEGRGDAPIVDPQSLAVRIGYDKMLAAMGDRRRLWPNDDAGYTAALNQREADTRRLVRRRDAGDMTNWEAMADRVIAAERLSIEQGSDAYAALVDSLAIATIDATDVFTRRAGGEIDAAPRTTLVREIKAKEAAKAGAGETILELFERWAAEMLAKGEKRADTINQDRKVIDQFAAYVGTDRAIGSIAPLDVAAYREALRNVPPKWRSNKALTGLAMQEAAVEARKLGLPQTAYTTINKHLSTISPLYKWLAAQPAWAGLRNPCDGLFYAKVKGKNPRPPFGTAALNTIVKSPLFTGFRADGAEHEPGNLQCDDWRKWIPTICLFTGARLGEIAQLRVGDVRRERGVWFIHIRHDESEGLSTKSGKSRPAAVHPILEQIGFLEWHQRQTERASDSPNAALFPELTANNRGQISGVPSRFWRGYLAAIGVKNGRDGFGSHSFRHTMADRLRTEAELLDDQIEVCLGHNQKTTTSGYGELSQGTVAMFKAWMDAVRFEGVEFGHLIGSKAA